MDYLTLQLSANEKPMDLSSIKLPYVIENKPLIAPGIWNGYYIGPEQIKRAFKNTDWLAKDVRYLYLDHEDKKAGEWVGEVRVNSIHMDSESGIIFGDLVIVDPATAIKLAWGAKFGISPSISAFHDNRVVQRFDFKNFGVVINPAMKTNYINNSQNIGGVNMEEENKVLEILDSLAKKFTVLEEKVNVIQATFNQEFEITDEQVIETAADSGFTEFFKKYKEKYPDATLKDAAKAYKKEQEKYPKAKKEEYPEPKTEKMGENKNFSDNLAEPAPAVPVAPVLPEPIKQEPIQELAKPEPIKIEPAKNNDVEIKGLETKIKLLEDRVKSYEKPVVDSQSTGGVIKTEVITDGVKEFIKYMKELEAK